MVTFKCQTHHLFHHVSVLYTELDETVWQTASIVRQELSKEEWYWGPASKYVTSQTVLLTLQLLCDSLHSVHAGQLSKRF